MRVGKDGRDMKQAVRSKNGGKAGKGGLRIGSIAAPRRVTFAELAYGQIRDAILTTQILPGTAVSENDLAAATGVSRTPIREAVHRLVEDRPAQRDLVPGCILPLIDTARAEQAIFVCRVVEREVLSNKGQIGADELAELDAQIGEHEKAIRAGDEIAAARLDFDFHLLLMTVCGCAEAGVAIRAISGDITRIMYLSGADGDYFASVAADHRDLVDLLRKGDFAQALDLLDRHLGGFVVDQERLKGQSADYFVT